MLDITPISLHSSKLVLQGKGKSVLPPSALLQHESSQGWCALCRATSGAPGVLGSFREGRRTFSSCTLDGKVRRPAAMAGVQGKFPTYSPGLLGKLKHL